MRNETPRWLRWSPNGAGRLVTVDLSAAQLDELDEMLRPFGRGPAVPRAVARLSAHADGKLRLGVPGDERIDWHITTTVASAVAALCRAFGVLLLRGALVERHGRLVCLTGPAAEMAAAQLVAAGGEPRGDRALVDLSDRTVLAEQRLYPGCAFVRAVHRADLGPRIVVQPLPDDDIVAALGALGTAANTTDELANLLRPQRMIFATLDAWPLALDGLAPAAPAKTLAPPTMVWLHAGDATLQLLLDGLTDEEQVRVGYATGGLAGEPAMTPLWASVSRTAAGYHLAVGLLLLQHKRVDAPALDQLLPYLDNIAQRVLLDEDRHHAIFLGSAVHRDGRAIWLCGAPASGKTALALELIFGRGFAPLSDDFVLWSPTDACLVPYPKALRLRRDMFAALPQLAGRGIQAPGSTNAKPAWLINPWLEAAGARLRLGNGLLALSQFDVELAAPFVCDAWPRPEVATWMRASLRGAVPEAEQAAIVDTLCERFVGVRLRFRDRRAAAVELERLAAAGSAS